VKYIQLLRVHHYIKNFLIFIPLFFSANILNPRYALLSLAGFIAFSLLSSIVYIINDLRDRDKDRLHSTKRLRPIASGRVSIRAALGVIATLVLVLVALSLGYTIGGGGGGKLGFTHHLSPLTHGALSRAEYWL
jgi:4-hydroxybenzoate polyprenyltransferase